MQRKPCVKLATVAILHVTEIGLIASGECRLIASGNG